MPKIKSIGGASLKKPSQQVLHQTPKIKGIGGASLKKPSQQVLPKIKGIGGASLKKPSQQVEKPVIKQTKIVRKPGVKLGVEIDEIFAGRKKKKPEAEIKETKEEIAKRERKRKRKERENPRAQPKKRIGDNSQNRPRKRTEDGLPVFTEDELCVNKANAGDTPLCPFDCNCCF